MTYTNQQNRGMLLIMTAACIHNGWMGFPSSQASCTHSDCKDEKHNSLNFMSISQFADNHGNSVHMRDPENVARKVTAMVQGGKQKLQVVSDFDRTLSRYAHNGKLVSTCHNMLEESRFLPESYKKQSIEVKDTYYPIEIDPQLTVEEKVPVMVEWWTKAHDLLVRYGLTKSALLQTVQDSNILLREGYEHLFKELYTHNIPLLIFSAGIGDVIEAVLQDRAKKYDNMHIVSNYMKFDEKGVLVGFEGDLIHTFNKNESAVSDSDYFTSLKGRENVLLLGDSLGDPHMADGVQGISNILKIGFLNNKIETSLEKYKEVFDIVLISDETLNIPNAIVHEILQR